MLKWKRVSVTAAGNIEELDPLLAGMAGKNRVIKSLSCDKYDDLLRLRVYRDADQIVDYDCDLLTAQSPLLPMDLPLAEGQQCNVGFYNGEAANVTLVLAIGYEETG